MSLFKLKSLWSQSYSNQQFDEKHLAIGQIKGQPAVALGNFKGILRIFRIKVKDPLEVFLIYENQFQSGIISVQFLENAQQNYILGVLLFRKFVYMTLNYKSSENRYVAQNTSIQCEPSFKIWPKQPLCLLNLNSSIQYINPLSTLKIKQSDPIFSFASCTHKNRKSIYYADGQQLVLVRSGVEQWRIILGEIRQIEIISNKQTQSASQQKQIVVVFGSNNIWQVSDAAINRSKIIDDELICGALIQKSDFKEEQFYNIAIANYQMHIMIYTRNYSLIWAIKYDNIPVTFRVFQNQQLKGALAVLTEDGMLEICYAGTELIQTQLEQLQQKTKIDIAQVEAETKRYLDEIEKKKNSSNQPQSNSISDNRQQALKLAVRALVPSVTTQIIESQHKLLQKNGGFWNCKVQCVITAAKQSISNVNASIITSSSIYCPNKSQKLPYLKDSETLVFSLFCSREKFASNSIVEIVVKYDVNDNRQSTNFLNKKYRLPVDFQCFFVSGQLLEKPENKIVLSASKELPSLSKMYPQFDSKLNDSKNMTVELSNGVQCSIGYNKTGTKVKIQSNFFSGLCYLMMSYLARFEQIKDYTKYQLTADKQPPLQQLVSIMKQHYDKRESLKACSIELEKKCQQFRAAQKKLLLKLKQKMTSSNQIQKLLQYTYNRLMKCADRNQRLRQQLKIISHNLQISLKFIIQLTTLKYKATQKCKQRVLGIIGYEQEGEGDYCWQEKVISNSAYFLNKGFNYLTDKYTFEQVYKTVNFVLSKIQAGDWNQ